MSTLSGRLVCQPKIPYSPKSSISWKNTYTPTSKVLLWPKSPRKSLKKCWSALGILLTSLVHQVSRATSKWLWLQSINFLKKRRGARSVIKTVRTRKTQILKILQTTKIWTMMRLSLATLLTFWSPSPRLSVTISYLTLQRLHPNWLSTWATITERVIELWLLVAWVRLWPLVQLQSTRTSITSSRFSFNIPQLPMDKWIGTSLTVSEFCAKMPLKALSLLWCKLLALCSKCTHKVIHRMLKTTALLPSSASWANSIRNSKSKSMMICSIE